LVCGRFYENVGRAAHWYIDFVYTIGAAKEGATDGAKSAAEKIGEVRAFRV